MRITKSKPRSPFFILTILLSLLVSSAFIFTQVEQVKGVPYWLREGSYAEYLLGSADIVFINDTSIHVRRVVYGWRCIEKTYDHAILETYLRLNMSASHAVEKQVQVVVDLASKNLIDPESEQVWGKCLFWIDPWDMGETEVVVMYNWSAQTLYGNVSQPFSEYDIPSGFGKMRTPFRDFETAKMCATSCPMVPWKYGNFMLSVRYDVKTGLAIGGFYLDDILYSKFDILGISGSTGYNYPAVLLDTNIFETEDGSSFPPWIIPAIVLAAASIPVSWIVWRRIKKRE